MIQQPKPRYVTRAINGELNIEIQVLLWELLDSIANERKNKMDYLQVFEIKCNGNNVKIINRQEQPAITKEMVLELGGLEIKDAIIWIIDESDYQMMLFPSDY